MAAEEAEAEAQAQAQPGADSKAGTPAGKKKWSKHKSAAEVGQPSCRGLELAPTRAERVGGSAAGSD